MIVLAMLFSSIASLKAQDDRLDELTFEETVIQEEKVPYFGVGGGFVVSLFTPELKDVNAQLSTAGLSELTTPLTMTGAIGVATIGILPNIRISIANLGGSISTAEKEFTVNQQQYLRSASLSNALYLIPGISGGWGTMEITTTQYAKGVETSNSTIGGSPNDVNVFNHSLRNNYFMVNPGLSVEFAPALLGSDKPRIITVRAHAGYALSFMGDWKENGKTIVNNVSSGIEASGLAFQLGFMIGLFN